MIHKYTVHSMSSYTTGLRCVGVHAMFLSFLHLFLIIFQPIKLIPTLCSSSIKLNSLETKTSVLCYAGSKMPVRVPKHKFFYAYVGHRAQLTR